MEMGIMEWAATLPLQKLPFMRRVEIGRVMAANDSNDVPAGFTAVFMRDIFFHVVPDEFLDVVKMEFMPSYQWSPEERTINCENIPLGGLGHRERELTRKYEEWAALIL